MQRVCDHGAAIYSWVGSDQGNLLKNRLEGVEGSGGGGDLRSSLGLVLL